MGPRFVVLVHQRTDGEVGSLSRETRRLNREARRLRREQEQLQDLKATVRRLTFETKLQRGELAGYHDQMDLIAGLRRRVGNLEIALRQSAVKEGLEAELDGRPLVSALFGRLRDRDKTIESLRKANERLGEKIKALRAHRASLQARIVQLRSTRAVLSKAVFGGRSERQETPRSDRKRGQQRGSPGQVAAWMTDQGLAIAPGTIAGSVRRFLPLFAPLAEAILAHQNEMAVRHGDETGWRIQALSETGRSRRAWLWISVGKDAVYYLIDPSRMVRQSPSLSAER